LFSTTVGLLGTSSHFIRGTVVGGGVDKQRSVLNDKSSDV
jgi:hypothetical protein